MSSWRWGALALALSALRFSAACGSEDPVPGPDGGAADLGPVDGGFVSTGTCAATVTLVPVSSARHVDPATQLSFESNPPAGGDHYPEWLRWAQRYDVVERGNYVHNAEHGGVILLLACPIGCEAVAARLEAIGRSLPKDALCRDPINARWLVARDPLLPAGVGVAAMAWGAIYTAECLDEASLRTFIGDHYGMAPEATCAEGSKP